MSPIDDDDDDDDDDEQPLSIYQTTRKKGVKMSVLFVEIGLI